MAQGHCITGFAFCCSRQPETWPKLPSPSRAAHVRWCVHSIEADSGMQEPSPPQWRLACMISQGQAHRNKKRVIPLELSSLDPYVAGGCAI